MLQSVRTTVDLKLDLFRALKHEAVSQQVSLKDVLQTAAEEYLQKKKSHKKSTTMQILRDLKSMSKWGKQKVNLTSTVIREREKLANL